MIIVTIRMLPRAGKRHELHQTLIAWTDAARREDGCARYHVFQDVEDDHVFLLMSEWVSQTNLDGHLRSSHFAALLGAQCLLRSPIEVHVYAVTSTAGTEAVDAARGKSLWG